MRIPRKFPLYALANYAEDRLLHGPHSGGAALRFRRALVSSAVGHNWSIVGIQSLGRFASVCTTGTIDDFRPDGLSQCIPGIQVEQHFLQPGNFRGKVVVVQHSGMLLAIAEASLPFVGSGQNIADHYNLSTLLGSAGDTTVRGAPVRPGHGHALLPGAEIHFRTSSDVVFTGLFVRRELVEQCMENLGIPESALSLHPDGHFRHCGEAGARYLRTLQNLIRYSVFEQDMEIPEAETFLRDLLNDYLLSVTAPPEKCRVSVARRWINRYSVVKKAEDFLEACSRTGDSIHLDRLCGSLGVSERALDYAFRDVVGISPYQYLLSMRLSRARGELLSPLCSSVKAAALHWGFSHLSRFADHYYRLFGELPRETISRRRKTAAEARQSRSEPPQE